MGRTTELEFSKFLPNHDVFLPELQATEPNRADHGALSGIIESFVANTNQLR